MHAVACRAAGEEEEEIDISWGLSALFKQGAAEGAGRPNNMLDKLRSELQRWVAGWDPITHDAYMHSPGHFSQRAGEARPPSAQHMPFPPNNMHPTQLRQPFDNHTGGGRNYTLL